MPKPSREKAREFRKSKDKSRADTGSSSGGESSRGTVSQTSERPQYGMDHAPSPTPSISPDLIHARNQSINKSPTPSVPAVRKQRPAQTVSADSRNLRNPLRQLQRSRIQKPMSRGCLPSKKMPHLDLVRCSSSSGGSGQHGPSQGQGKHGSRDDRSGGSGSGAEKGRKWVTAKISAGLGKPCAH